MEWYLARSVERWWSRLPEKITSPENVSKDEVGSFILLHATYNTYISNTKDPLLI